MNRRKRKIKKIERLNLIPIMDAIFIFIFFLLMSAQFIDIFSIGSDVPVVTELNEPPKKEPLNLTLEIRQNVIVVKTGLKGNVHKELKLASNGEFPFEELHKLIVGLKKLHPKENSINIMPMKKVKYKVLVRIMDEVSELKKNEESITSEERALFDQIVFTNLMG